MKTWYQIASSALALVVLSGVPAEACSCVLPLAKPCQAFWQAHTVFTGVVRSIDTEEVTFGQFRTKQYVVTFDAVQLARGAPAEPMRVRTGLGGGDCGYAFKVGQPYIVYAYRNRKDGSLSTGICSRTAPVSRATEDVAYIGGLGASPPPTARGQIAGVVKHIEDRRGPDEPGLDEPWNDTLAVTLTGARESFDVDSRNGRFEARVPPGKYRVDVHPPAGFYAQVWPKEVFVADARACADVTVRVSVDGRITGQILDAAGAPVAGLGVHVIADARPADAFWWDKRSITDAEGRFTIDELPPGGYAVGPHVPDPAIDSAAVREHAWTSTRLETSGHQDVGALRLPSGVNVGAIRGTVLDADGAPVANASVSLQSESREGRERFDHVLTDDQGRFVLAAITGRRYVVRASSHDSGLDDQGEQVYKAFNAISPTAVTAGDTITFTLTLVPEP